MRLDEAIDIEQAERLLEQHSNYDIGGGVSVSRRAGSSWLIYYNSVEVTFFIDFAAEVTRYERLADALARAFSPRLREEVDAAVARHAAAGGAA